MGTCWPRVLKSVNVTYDARGKAYRIVVAELNGFGTFWLSPNSRGTGGASELTDVINCDR